MLLELGIGDAYGAGFEYADPDFITRHNDVSRYVKHPRHSTPPGNYTDDTQMSIAIAEAIVSGEEWTPLNLATRIVKAFKRDPRVGYAGEFYHFLTTVKNSQEFVDKIHPDSDKSGAAMRAAPIGYFPTIQEVIEKATIQAKLTHDTPDGIRAALASALMSHYFLYNYGVKKNLPEFLESHAVGKWSKPWRGKVGSKGWMSVTAAVTAVLRNDTMSNLLKGCIAFSGDVDTVATIALAAGSCSNEIEQDLPEVLISRLENGPYGKDYLIGLDRQLQARKSNS